MPPGAVECVPRADTVQVVGDGTARVRSGETSYEGCDEDRACRGTLVFWYRPGVAENVVDEQTGAISFASAVSP
jgi:hypothetical protein